MPFQIEEQFTRKVWKKLRDNQVPIIPPDRYHQLPDVVRDVNTNLETREYLPSVGHGVLGTQKGGGVTRFIPILTDVDIAVYYHLCFGLSDLILKRQNGIFGGWHQTPKSMKAETIESNEEDVASGFLQDYFSNPFSSTLWLREWNNFNDLIRELCADRSIGNYVVQSDVANFYDSIEVPRLVRRLRGTAPKQENHIETLAAFLGSWNRRYLGYSASTKGIPQEIISDASRILSHFYLQNFDESFRDYCNSEGLTYVRWADDILVFGNSKRKLERAIHRASKLLLLEGLHLNAAKTEVFSRSGFARYRGLALQAAISKNQPFKFRSELGKLIDMRNKGQRLRIDTVFRSTIGYTRRLGASARTFEKNFLIEEVRKNTDLLSALNARQLANLILVDDDPKRFYKWALDEVIKMPFAGPRAIFLHMMRKHRSELARYGIKKSDFVRAIKRIGDASDDSEVLLKWSVPEAERAFL